MRKLFYFKRKAAKAVILSVICLLASAAVMAQTDNKGGLKQFTVSKNLYSTGRQDVADYSFEANRYGQVKIKIYGAWTIQAIGNASRVFEVSVNGKYLMRDQGLVGEKVFNYTLDSLEFGKPLSVHVAMETNTMASKASGTVEVTCYEGQVNNFYVEEVIYHFDKQTQSPSSQPMFGESAEFTNNQEIPVHHSFELAYTESESLSWEESGSTSGRVELSMGNKAPDATGGAEFQLKLIAEMMSGWKKGKAHTTERTSKTKSDLTVPAGKSIEVYILRTQIYTKVPYTLKGYYVKPGGVKEPGTMEKYCTFTNYKIKVYSRNPGTNDEPILLKTLEEIK